MSPAAVSGAYLAARWTYRYTDPVGCTAALTGAPWTTSPFAARSTPGPSVLAQLMAARESSTVRVLSAARSAEAPSTDTTTFTTVRFIVTRTYAGTGSGLPADHIWSLRLVRDGGRWRVDGVVVAG